MLILKMTISCTEQMNITACVSESIPNNILQQVFNAFCTMFRPNVAEVHVPDRQCYMVLYHMEHKVLDLDSSQSSFFLKHIKFQGLQTVLSMQKKYSYM